MWKKNLIQTEMPKVLLQCKFLFHWRSFLSIFPPTTTIRACIHNDLLFFIAFAFCWPICHLLTLPCLFNRTPPIWRSILLLLTNWKNMLDGRFRGNPGHPQSKINPSPPAQMHLIQIIVLLLVWKYLDWWFICHYIGWWCTEVMPGLWS